MQQGDQSLLACSSSCRQTLGLHPKGGPLDLHSCYSSYDSLCSYRMVDSYGQSYRTQALCKIQRQACLAITGAMRSTPTAAMETILGLAPPHLVVEQQAMVTCFRLKLHGQWTCAARGSHSTIERRLSTAAPICTQRSDSVAPLFKFNRSFSLQIGPRDIWQAPARLFPATALVCYTDGSRQAGCNGAGVFIPDHHTTWFTPLGCQSTVFQAEVFALKECARLLLDLHMKDRIVYICSDSQAALRAVSAVRISSALVLECRLTLDRFAAQNELQLVWVPGHSGVPGNERADSLARLGSSTAFTGPEPCLPITTQTVKTHLQQWLRWRHTREWRLRQDCRQGRELLSGAPSPSQIKRILRLSRVLLSDFTGVISGHFFNKHFHRIGLVDSATCALCGGEDETSCHILGQCPRLANIRSQLLGGFTLAPRELQTLPVHKILQFLRDSGRMGW